MKPPSPEVLKYLKERASEGGRAVKKKYGRKHFAELGKSRKYAPCAVPRPSDPSLRHRFDPKTGICYGCKLNRKNLE